MKVKISELKQIVADMVNEASKAKKGKKPKAPSVIDPPNAVPRPAKWQYDEAFDFSQPLGKDNLYRGQGQASWGPNTGTHSTLNLNGMEARAKKSYGYSESTEFVNDIMNEAPTPVSHWDFLKPTVRPEPVGVWETLERLAEKHIGFKKLKGQLAHKKGVKDPGALAASIGRKKYGAAGMAKKAAGGK